MYFRCSECLASTWTDGVGVAGGTERLICGDCGTSYTVPPREGLGSTVAHRYRASLEIGNQCGLDMASAYSVLLGLFTLKHALSLREQGSSREPVGPDVETEAPARPDTSEEEPSPREPIDSSPLLEFDPGFQKAVDEGHLSVRQAVGRGDREAYVTSLERRHDLPRGLALKVADNRVSIREALNQKPVPTPKPVVRKGKRASVVQTMSALAVAGVTLAGASSYVWNQHFEKRAAVVQSHAHSRDVPGESRQAPGEPAAVRASPESAPLPIGAEIRRNQEGEVIEILAADPASVLVAFCRISAQKLPMEPIEVTETVPRLGDARLGVFRDLSAIQSRSAIWIRKDRRTRRWIAGDGKGPIPVRVAPDVPEGGFRRPVESS